MNKVLLITGAARGIGAATASLAVKQGYTVVINYLSNHAAAKSLFEQITVAGGQASLCAADVSTEEGIATLFSHVDTVYGRLDALVNNAGVVDQVARVDAMDYARLERMFQSNCIGPILCAGEAVKRMSTRYGKSGGAIVNISSRAATIGSPNQYVDYAASKGAIDTFTLGLAKELAQEGIRVNGVRPGIIDTDIHASGGQPNKAIDSASGIPMQRAGRSEEVAEAIVWLLSDAASYTTGAMLDVAGGR